MTSTHESFAGIPLRVELRNLRLDSSNPRLPPSQQGLPQEDLAVILEMGFDAFTVAESISRHGFFESEPLIVIAGESPDSYTVVEGNRRLTALIGLADPQVRREFASPDRWEEIADGSSVSMETIVPVVLAPNREACTPIIGFRHISGILQWVPYAQARYVASLVDQQGLSFDEVHRLIGIDKRDVASLYREQAIADQAAELGFETGGLERSFSLLQVAMNSTKIREFVGAPLASKVTTGTPPIPADKTENLKEVLGYIFGSAEVQPAINDSRQISQLGNVIAEEKGLEALRSGLKVHEAKQKMDDARVDPRSRLLKRLETVCNSLEAALEDFSEFADDSEVTEKASDILDLCRELRPPDGD